MRKLHKMVATTLAVLMLMFCMLTSTALAADKAYDARETNVIELYEDEPQEEAGIQPQSDTPLFTYNSSSFYMMNNEGKFTSNVNSNDSRIVVAAIRADGTKEGTITVKVYKKNLIGKTPVMNYTCDADGRAHTSNSFSVSKNANYVVEIYTSTAQKSIVSIIIGAA